MIEVNLKPYCDKCPHLRANTSKGEQVGNGITREPVTKIECIHKAKRNQIESYIKDSVWQDMNPWMDVKEFQPPRVGEYEIIVQNPCSEPKTMKARWEEDYGGYWDTKSNVIAWRNLMEQHKGD